VQAACGAGKPRKLDLSKVDDVRASFQKERTPVAKRVLKMNKEHRANGGKAVAPATGLIQQNSDSCVPQVLSHLVLFAISVRSGCWCLRLGFDTVHPAVVYWMQTLAGLRLPLGSQPHAPL
jgi:hypothetical protein